MVKFILILLVLKIPNVINSEAPYCQNINKQRTIWRCWNHRNFPTGLYNASNVEKLELSGHLFDWPSLVKLTSKDLQLYKLPNLVELQLDNYRFDEIEPGAFKNGGKLVNLTLHGNEMKKLDPQVFTDVPNLQKLEIINQRNFDGPRLKNFENLEFPNLENLTELVLHSVGIRSLKRNLLKNLKSLQILDLFGNQLTILDDREIFRPLKNLKVFKAQWNQIYYVDPEVFADLQNLEILDLSNNRFLQWFKNGSKFHNPKLVRLDLHNCKLNFIQEDLFENIGSLKELNLGDNQLFHISQKMFSLKNLEMLSLSSNQIKTLEPGIFLDLGNLTSLDLSRNQVPNLDDRSVFRPLKNLKVLRLEENSIGFVDPEVFADLQNLEILDLWGNKLDEGFKNGTQFPNLNLITLDLRSCQLKYIEENLFENLGNLKQLVLDRNRLSSISQKMFSSLKNLEKLWLYNNSIQTLESDIFSGLGNLRLLDLQNNQLKSLDWKVLRPLKKLSTVSLESNPWQCDCQVLFLREFLKQGNIIFDFIYTNLKCTTFGARGEPIPNQFSRGFMTWKDINPEELNCTAFPNITNLSADKEPKLGESVNLQCGFNGGLPLQVIWMKDDAILRNFTISGDGPLRLQNNRSLMEYKDELKIQNLKEEDAGIYKVIVSNEAGEIEKSEYFELIKEPPALDSATELNVEPNLEETVNSQGDPDEI